MSLGIFIFSLLDKNVVKVIKVYCNKINYKSLSCVCKLSFNHINSKSILWFLNIVIVINVFKDSVECWTRKRYKNVCLEYHIISYQRIIVNNKLFIMQSRHFFLIQCVSWIQIKIAGWLFSSQLSPPLKQASFFETAGTVAKIGLILKSNHYRQI